MDGNKRGGDRQILPEPRVIINGKVQGYVEDISKSGAGLILNKDAAKEAGEKISFMMDFGKGIFFRSVFIQEALIKWNTPKHYLDFCKIGVEFIKISDEESHKLNEFLNFWEQDEEKIINHVNNLLKIVENPEILSLKELQKILLQFSYLRIIPLSYKITELIKNINVCKKMIGTFEKISEFGTDELKNLEDTIVAYESAQHLTTQELQQKEEVIDAYEKLQDFMRRELKEKEALLQATQKVLEIADAEKKEKDKTIEALQIIEELMRNEQIDKDKMILAHEALQGRYREEILEKEALITAYEELQSLYQKEILDKNSILDMHTILEKLTQKELIEKDKEIKVRDMISELSRNEIVERQKVIDAYDQFASVMKEEIIHKDLLLKKIEKTNKEISNESE
ncbi:MAG: hypothetical protein A2Y41_07030 [Spirochaetes bacterium GWB1_36_13]|nr:MAG: hypothetical protein A2Y41_07030 [Spirochaetes bacterium GWB1_36_13]